MSIETKVSLTHDEDYSHEHLDIAPVLQMSEVGGLQGG
jgi:hypothetical protein